MNLWNTLVVRTDNHVYPGKNFATEHADIRRTVSSVISETKVNHICCHVGLTVDIAVRQKHII